MLKKLMAGVVGVLALLVAACNRQPEVEKVPVGADVQLTRQDGGVVEGKLTARDEQAVKVDVGKVTRSVPRDQIAHVRVVKPDEAAPELPPMARFREYTVPEGTELSVELESAVSSATSKVEEPIEARLIGPVKVSGTEVLAAGSRLRGEVASVQPAGKVKGRASLSLRFSSLTANGETYRTTGTFAVTAPSTKKEDAQKIGIPAAGGAIIGGILGGKKGAAIGAAVGGGAGAATVLMTPGKDISLGRGTNITVTLQQPLEVRVPVR